MKALVWFALGAALLRPERRRDWFGEHRGRFGSVIFLAVAWALLDAGAVRLGLKAPATAPSATDMLTGWNATLNVLFIAPLFEEVLFRGLIWSKFEAAGLRSVHVWLLTAAAFAALHGPGWIATRGASPELLPWLGLAFLAGLFCGAGRWLTGSVWPAAFLHLVNNLVSMGFLPS